MDNETQKAKVYRPSASDLSNPLSQIARYVAATGQILNIGDVTTWLKKDVVQAGSDPIKSILCMPIVNGQRNVIGVAQLINKVKILMMKTRVPISQNSPFRSIIFYYSQPNFDNLSRQSKMDRFNVRNLKTVHYIDLLILMM